MPVFHFTYHAYRSWNTDKMRGWIQHGEKGIKRPSEALAAYRDRLAKHPPMRFARHQQWAIIEHMRAVAHRRGWEPYAISANPTHVHVVI